MTATAPDALKAYLADIESAHKAGNATEHTHRPALKTLLETLAGDDIRATNEPKRENCGAPDFIVTRGVVPLGYVEAKDVGKPLDPVERSEQLRRYRDALGNLVRSCAAAAAIHLGRPAALNRFQINGLHCSTQIKFQINRL